MQETDDTTRHTPDGAAAAEIRALLAGWSAAARAKDLDRIIAVYAPDVVAFDAVLALRFEGLEAYRAHWQACMAYCPGDMHFELHDLEVTVRGDLGFCHALVSCGGAGPDGVVQTGWMRMTGCLERRGGAWKVVHEHHSAPFDPESGQALLGLRPERATRALVA